MRKRAIIAIGSNATDANSYFDRAISELSSHEDTTMAQSTQRVWTEPIACNGVNADSQKFLNSLVEIETTLDYTSLTNRLKDVETKLGASKTDKRQGKVKIDLDILSYDNERYHADDWNRQYIQALIQEL